jgi:uncharacterized membrane protein (UPF0136 family)
MHTLYLNYGISIAALGLVGFFLTHAKSALISGLASGAILILISFFVDKVPVVKIIGKVVNILLIGAFGWRVIKAVMAIMDGADQSLVKVILVSTMLLISIVSLILSLKKS